MFIKFFKSSFFSQYLVIGVIGLMLWAGSFTWPPAMPEPVGPVPFYRLIYSLVHTVPVVSVILGFLLVMGETYWLTTILNRHDLVQKNSSLSALVCFVLLSMNPEQLILNPVNLTLAFLILILHHLLISYKKPEHLDHIFAAGFYTAIYSVQANGGNGQVLLSDCRHPIFFWQFTTSGLMILKTGLPNF